MQPHLVGQIFGYNAGAFRLISGRIELRKPCRKGRNISNCPKFQDGQPEGPAFWPHWYFSRIDAGHCPMCDLDGRYNRDNKRMIKIIATGAKFGAGAGRNEAGLDFYDRSTSCCAVM